MSNSSPLPHPRSTLDLSIPSSNVSIPFQEALVEGSPLPDALLSALRDAPSLARTRLTVAIELVDIIENARAVLKTIRTTLDDPLRVDPWSPNKYDTSKLMNPGSDLADPDYYFSKNATSKARVLFRVTSKETYYRVKRLAAPDRLILCSMYDSADSFDPGDYHNEISGWITRFEKRLEAMQTPAQKEPRKAVSRKRQQGANANPSSKRRAIRELPNQATSPAVQPPSKPFRSNSTQVADTANQSMPPYQNQPAQQTMQQDTFRIDNLAHLTAAHQRGQMFYQGQESSHDSASRLEGHQPLPPQGQQRQEQEQQQEQQQGQQQKQQQEKQQQEEQQQEEKQEQQSIDFIADEVENQFYPEFLYQYSD